MISRDLHPVDSPPELMLTGTRVPHARPVGRLAAVGSLAAAIAVTVTIVFANALHQSPPAEATTDPAPAQAGIAPAAKPTPPATNPAGRAFTLNWVGDIALSGSLGLPPGGVRAALSPVAPLLAGADLEVGNLEGTLSTVPGAKCAGATSTAKAPSNCFAFQAPPAAAGDLKAAGFGLVNQANNHSMDFGEAGRAQTLAALKAAGIAQTGLPGEITLLTVHGVRVAFLGFAPYRYDSNLLDIPTAQAMIRQARREAQVVVVFIHDGAEGSGETHTPQADETYLGEDRGDARAFAHAAIDAGAALVLGSGPHVIRGVEAYHGHLIAYSLGNFVGYHTLGGGGVLSDSGVMHVTVSAGGEVLAAQWRSVVLDSGLPQPDPTGTSAKLAAQLSAEDFPTDHFTIGSDGSFHP